MNNYIFVKLYRPITLLDTIEKTLEPILAKKISAIAKIHPLLSKTYFGGKRYTFIEYAIHYLVEKTYVKWD